MRIYLQALVFILLAIPFIYMLYDVTRDLFLQTVSVISRKTRPLVNSLISTFIK